MQGFRVDLLVEIGVLRASIRGTIRIVDGPRASGPILVRLLKEEGNMLRYGITLSPPVPNSQGVVDVVERRLLVVLNGQEESLQTIGRATDGTFPQPNDLLVAQESQVHLELRDVDDAGNIQDPPTVLDFHADTEAPVSSGPIALAFKGEEPDEPSPQEPPTEA